MGNCKSTADVVETHKHVPLSSNRERCSSQSGDTSDKPIPEPATRSTRTPTSGTASHKTRAAPTGTQSQRSGDDFAQQSSYGQQPATPGKTGTTASSKEQALTSSSSGTSSGKIAQTGQPLETPRSSPRSRPVATLDNVVPDAARGSLLKHVPLLKSLSESERDKLGALMHPRVFNKDEVIFKTGDLPDGFYAIIRGRVRVQLQEANTKTFKTVAILQKGDYFGEAAIVNNERRGAWVVAEEDNTQTLFLEKSHFDTILQERPGITFARRRGGVTATIAAADELKSNISPEAYQKTSAVREMLLEALNSRPHFKSLTVQQKLGMIDSMYRETIPAGTTIIRQGDLGTNLYIIEKGSVVVTQTKSNQGSSGASSGGQQDNPRQINVGPAQGGEVIAHLGAGKLFGDLAIMYHAPRNATVTTDQETTVWAIDRFTYRRVTQNIGESQIHTVVRFLAEVPLLRPLSSQEREKIAEAVEEVRFDAGAIVCKEGDQGDCMYFLVDGACAAYKRGINDPVAEYMLPGSFFGELALKSGNEGRRQATVVALQPTLLLKLDSESFKILLGPLEDHIDKHSQKYKEDHFVETEIKEREQPLWSNLEPVGMLGSGSYGTVVLVRDVSDGKQYALKSVWKQQIVNTNQVDHILSERQVMTQLQHPFLVQLYGTYHSKDRIHFLLEPCLAGDLFSVIQRRKMFSEDLARFYAASVALGFAYLHSKDTIYRDLKPENLMLTPAGHLKIADFGFAKKIKGKTWTFCGTPEYLAPEVLRMAGQGKAVDWWTLGILIYEMLASYTPFADEDNSRLFSNILEAELRFPDHFSDSARHIISALLDRRPARRLGVGKGGFERLCRAPWFASFDWESLINLTMRPPLTFPVKPAKPFETNRNTMPFSSGECTWDAEFGPLVSDRLRNIPL